MSVFLYLAPLITIFDIMTMDRNQYGKKFGNKDLEGKSNGVCVFIRVKMVRVFKEMFLYYRPEELKQLKVRRRLLRHQLQ